MMNSHSLLTPNLTLGQVGVSKVQHLLRRIARTLLSVSLGSAIISATFPADMNAATVGQLNTQTATATGAGASGTPSIASFSIPSGKNRVLFIWASFERDHCSPADATAGLASNTNTAGTGLGDNWPEPRIGTPPATTTNNQITAQVIGSGGTISKKNALVIGGSPSGDLRFLNISTSPTGSPAGTAFFSMNSFHIALFEDEINTLLGGAASGTVSISLPDVTIPSNAGDDSFIVASVFENVEQAVTAVVRNSTATAQVTTGTAGNFALAPAAYDAGQAPNEADDGKLLLGASSSTGGFSTPSGYTALATLALTNANGTYDTPNGNVNNEPNGYSGGMYFSNGGATPGALFTLLSAGASTPLVYGGTGASFLLESDNADISDAPASYGNPTHTISGIRLGATVDADSALLSSAGAAGDDTSNTDDEDGVTIPAQLLLNQTQDIPISIQNASGYLSAWFDWNADGDFSDAGEQVASDMAVAVGNINLQVSVPGSATSGSSFARFRVSTSSGGSSSPTTTASSGEVEDYPVTIGSPSSNADLSNLTTTAGSFTFAAATTSYSFTVPTTTTGVTVTATRADAGATLHVRVNNGSYIPLTSGTASGTLMLDVGQNTIDVRVTAQNGTTTKTYTLTVTREAALVSSLVRVSPELSNAATVSWTLTFSSPVVGVTASNFTLSGPAATGASVGTPTTANSGLTWTIPVSTGADGTLTLDLANATGLSPAISTTLPYAGESYTIDKTAPTVQSVTRFTPAGQATSLTTVVFRVTYSEPVTLNTPEAARFAVVPVNGSTIVGAVTGVTGSGNSRDVTVNITSGTGEFRLRVLD